MKRINSEREMKKEIKINGKKFFLWKRKKAKNLISDFTVAESFNDSNFKFKEYCIIEEFPMREEIQQVRWDSISFANWEIYLLDEEETSHYTKLIMARKIIESNGNKKKE